MRRPKAPRDGHPFSFTGSKKAKAPKLTERLKASAKHLGKHLSQSVRRLGA